MNQGINGSMTHGFIDGAGSGHLGHVPWDGGGWGAGNPWEGCQGPQVLAARCRGYLLR